MTTRRPPMLRPRALLAVLALLAGPAAAATLLLPEAGPATAPALREAISRTERGELDAAEQQFEALRADPAQRAAAWLGLAEIAARRGQPAEAESLLRRGLAAEPGAPELHRALGRLLGQTGRSAEMEAAFRAAAALRPAEAQSLLELADIWSTRLNEPARALPIYAEAATRAPTDWRIAYGRGVALARTGPPGPALAAFEEAAGRNPSSPLPDTARARLLVAAQRWPEALDAFDRAIARAPGFAEARMGRAALLLALGRPADSAAEYRRAAALDRGPGPLIGLGMAAQSAGDMAAAEAAYRDALARDPQNPIAANNLAWLAAEAGRGLDEALRLARLAEAALPRDPSVLTTLGAVLARRGDRAGAEAALAQAVAIEPRADRLTRLATLRAAAGRRDEAIADLRRALELAPGDAAAAAELQRVTALPAR